MEVFKDVTGERGVCAPVSLQVSNPWHPVTCSAAVLFALPSLLFIGCFPAGGYE